MKITQTFDGTDHEVTIDHGIRAVVDCTDAATALREAFALVDRDLAEIADARRTLLGAVTATPSVAALVADLARATRALHAAINGHVEVSIGSCDAAIDALVACGGAPSTDEQPTYGYALDRAMIDLSRDKYDRSAIVVTGRFRDIPKVVAVEAVAAAAQVMPTVEPDEPSEPDDDVDVLFTLSMPGVGSWDGKWTQAGKHHAITRRMSQAAADKLVGGDSATWSHDFGDGWRAAVTARLVTPGEKLRKSAGFCGYEWMVDNIIRHDSTRDPNEIPISSSAADQSSPAAEPTKAAP